MRNLIASVLFLVILAAVGCGGQDQQPAPTATPTVDGRLEAGLRVLTLDPAAAGKTYRIYRGDYIRCELPDGGAFTLEIPDLEVSKAFPVPEGEKPYVKVPEAGAYAFTAGSITGTIEALEYQASAYREVSAVEAAGFIENLSPVILDVRTQREYTGGHLEGAQLVPVQVFKRQLPRLMDLRDRPVLVYCRTGNRSTVAAKLLVDAGFTNVVNLRRGIVEWQREGRPTIR